MKTIRGVIQAPKFAKVPTAIRNRAWEVGLSLQIEVESGFLRETIRYAVTGEDDLVNQFYLDLKLAESQWNKR